MQRRLYDEGAFMDSRGTKFFYRVWRARRAKAVLALLHALGLHSGKYTWLCEELASRGITCSAVDLYGHGLSEGPRGGSLSGALTSGEKFLQLVAAKLERKSLVVAGHGSGALVALHSVRALDLRCGVLALSPLHDIAPHLNRKFKLKLASLLNSRVKVYHRPLHDARHRSSPLELQEDNLVIDSAPAKLVLGLLRMVWERRCTGEGVAIFEESDSEALNFFRSICTLRAELRFDPRCDEIPIERAIEMLVGQ